MTLRNAVDYFTQQVPGYLDRKDRAHADAQRRLMEERVFSNQAQQQKEAGAYRKQSLALQQQNITTDNARQEQERIDRVTAAALTAQDRNATRAEAAKSRSAAPKQQIAVHLANRKNDIANPLPTHAGGHDGGSPEEKDRREFIQQRIQALTAGKKDSMGNWVEMPMSVEDATAHLIRLHEASTGTTPNFSDVQGGSRTSGAPTNAPGNAGGQDPHAQQRADYDAAAAHLVAQGKRPEDVIGPRP